jgi:hypothetical protein
VEWKKLVYSIPIWNKLRPLVLNLQFGIFSPRFGILCQEKSGSPEKQNPFCRNENSDKDFFRFDVRRKSCAIAFYCASHGFVYGSTVEVEGEAQRGNQ